MYFIAGRGGEAAALPNLLLAPAMQLMARQAHAACGLVLIAVFQLSTADLPVHCLLQDVAGEWDFMVGPPQKPAFDDMVAGIPQCGHHIPNTVLSMLSADPKTEVAAAGMEQFRVKLTEDIHEEPMRHLHVVGGTNSSSAAAGNIGGGGYWTMVFDEGFEVRSHDGRSFFAHFYFEALPDAGQKPSHGDRWDDIAQYYGRVKGKSVAPPKGDLYACHCDRLSVGWWHQRSESGKLESGCFWAKKAEPKPESVGLIRWSKAESKSAGGLNHLRGGNSKAATVSLHNLAGLTPVTDNGKVLDVNEIPTDSDRTMLKEVLLPPARELQSELDQIRSSKHQSRAFVQNATKSTSGDLPKFFDWRDIVEDMSPQGVDDLSEQFNQGNCGSCYAFSGTLVLQMRFRIQLFKQHGILYPLELSWKSATSCSPYTEGCEGGFAYLTFKYAAEVGLPLAECDRARTPKSLDQACDWGCYRNNKDIFYAKNYGQTGGFAHGSDEESIMEEIHKNGPVIVSFAASAIPEFIYNNGQSYRKETEVLTIIKNEKVAREPSSKNSEILPWSYTTHSILAVGWGEETAPNGSIVKYWVVRNSWGKDWGEQGYAKIRRGNNDAAIETSAPWVEPDMDRLPPGFLEKAKEYHVAHEAARAKAKAAPAGTQEVAPTKNKGGRPAYCKMRPDSPDCK